MCPMKRTIAKCRTIAITHGTRGHTPVIEIVLEGSLSVTFEKRIQNRQTSLVVGALAALRHPTWSIYDVLGSTHSPLRLFWG